MKNLMLFLILISGTNCLAQIEWQKSLGSSGYDDVWWSLEQTSDGGYIIGGTSYVNDGDVTGNHGSNDCWIIKLSSLGVIEWQKSLGGSNGDGGDPSVRGTIKQTADGGYIVAATSSSIDGDITGHHGVAGPEDFWIVKLSDTGTIVWQKSLGGSSYDAPGSIQQTFDGGYIIAGFTSSNDGDVAFCHGDADYWVVKINDTGRIEWEKTYGGSQADVATAIVQTFDSGYIVAGFSQSSDGDVSGHHGPTGPGDGDYWIIKLSSSGMIVWQKSLGGTERDEAYSIQQTRDSGYIVAGRSVSNDGDVTLNHSSWDGWVVKLSSSGGIQWQKSLGGSGEDFAWSVKQTTDGGYIVCGLATSNDGDVSGNHGISTYGDCWVVKLSSSGNIQWQKCLGGTSTDNGFGIIQTADGGYAVAAESASVDGDVTGNHGSNDIWIVKLSASTSVNTVSEPSVAIVPNPTRGDISITGTDKVDIKVYNTIGQLLKVRANTDKISISEFPTGMYFIQLYDESGMMLKQEKIMKE